MTEIVELGYQSVVGIMGLGKMTYLLNLAWLPLSESAQSCTD